MSSVATDEMSSVATEEMSSVATEEMSSVAAEEMSSVATGDEDNSSSTPFSGEHAGDDPGFGDLLG